MEIACGTPPIIAPALADHVAEVDQIHGRRPARKELLRILRRWCSFNTITWSRHSRRNVRTIRSATAFAIAVME
jgi:hypothetical protein